MTLDILKHYDAMTGVTSHIKTAANILHKLHIVHRPILFNSFVFPLQFLKLTWYLLVLGRCSQTSVLSLTGSLPNNDG